MEDYPSTGVSPLDLPLQMPLNIPQVYSWVSEELRATKSKFEAGLDMSRFARRISRYENRLWNVEGMFEEEHVATFPSSLKFVMYFVTLTRMHIRPPFTRFQQEVLARLEVAPSQLHPNAWAYIQAFELVCIHLEKITSIELFFHLFEVNRRRELPKTERRGHVSLRARRHTKIFRPY